MSISNKVTKQAYELRELFIYVETRRVTKPCLIKHEGGEGMHGLSAHATESFLTFFGVAQFCLGVRPNECKCNYEAHQTTEIAGVMHVSHPHKSVSVVDR